MSVAVFGQIDAEDEDAVEQPPVPVPWHAWIPGVSLTAVMAIAWLVHIPSGGMAGWGVSAAALSQGRYETIFLHAFAHGGLFHILMNGFVLVELGAALTARLGTWPHSWIRFFSVFSLSALAGMALYLAIHPNGSVPMVGASGAIYGLLGLFVRLKGQGLHEAGSPHVRKVAWSLIKDNALWFAILTLPALISGRGGGLAWEAHLGGILFGFFVGPYFLPRGLQPASESDGVEENSEFRSE